MPLLVANVKLPGEFPTDDALRTVVSRHLGVATNRVTEVTLVRRSLDGRARTPAWRGNLRVTLDHGEGEILGRSIAGVRGFTDRDEARLSGSFPVPEGLHWTSRPIVIGAGPAGLFAALRLGEAGASAILLERGQAVEGRIPAVNGFWRGGPIDPDNNILFGEGGAGTFSDGKIYTRRRDGELGYIFKRAGPTWGPTRCAPSSRPSARRSATRAWRSASERWWRTSSSRTAPAWACGFAVGKRSGAGR